MEKSLAEKHEVKFDEATCALFADILQQEIANVKVLFYLASCMQSETQATVKTITDSVKLARKVGKRDKDNTLSFTVEDAYIDRKTAERIVDRLSHMSLVYMEVQWPNKFIKLTNRGVQVAIHIKKSEGK